MKNLCHCYFLLIIICVLESFRKHFLGMPENIIYFSKIDFEKCFMVNRIKQPEGCIGISEKCDLQGKVCRVATESNLNGFF